MDYQSELERLQGLVNDGLRECFAGDCAQRGLLEAMRYSLLAGGKRIRPVLLLGFCRACGGDEQSALPAACGVEMLHTYSLIHDDLPCMDNDDLRRGKPTCHKAYGETAAVLAGDALQAAAFFHVLSAPLPPERTAAMARTLAESVGERGMCGGQYLDTCGEGGPPGEDGLRLIHTLKTGALLSAACVMGVQSAGGGPEQVAAAADYALHLGLAFQIRDDVLDRISTTEELGKPAFSDAAMGKETFATLLGEERCARLVGEHTRLAKAALGSAIGENGFLLWLADLLAERKK